jgi:MFS-type transporter involved in bile tolerance (Atg22 family)
MWGWCRPSWRLFTSGNWRGDFQNPTAVWGILSVVAVLVSSVAALAAASLAGRMSRFSLLAGLTLGLLAAMAALAWNPNGSLAQAALAFVAAQSFYFAAMTIYESFLPDIVPPEARQKLSGFGWATGYLGGLLAIIVLLVLIGGRPQSLDVLALCFIALAIVGGLAFAIVIPVMRHEGFATLIGKGGGATAQGRAGRTQALAVRSRCLPAAAGHDADPDGRLRGGDLHHPHPG